MISTSYNNVSCDIVQFLRWRTYTHFVLFCTAETFTIVVFSGPAETLKVVVGLEPIS